MENFKQRIEKDFKEIQNIICKEIEKVDGLSSFEAKPWQKGEGDMLQGYGEMRVMRGGNVFEKAGVNFSHVHGTFSEQFRKEIPGAVESEGKFWACGVSLVFHPKNPFVPIVHMNIRRIETSKGWFGGGSDLTPVFPVDEDTKFFHETLKQACDTYTPEAYADMKKACDEYFFIKHWGEPRGIGGIFFDGLNSGDFEKDFDFVKESAHAFLKAYSAIASKHKHETWTEDDKNKQSLKRAKYVEFNLIYDRGTRFGFMTGGNPEAILMSMPPMAIWP